MSSKPSVATDKRRANAERQYTVYASDLPLSCPMPDMMLWNSHPRVYVPVEVTGEAKCPYCGAFYVLADADRDGAVPANP